MSNKNALRITYVALRKSILGVVSTTSLGSGFSNNALFGISCNSFVLRRDIWIQAQPL